MEQNQNQEERRADTVAIPRSTVKAATWLASISFVGVSTFIWNLGSQVDDMRAGLDVLKLQTQTLQDFARAGGRFTESDGNKLERRIDKLQETCENHRGEQAHREQKQLNREMLWRIEKLEVKNSDAH